MRPGEIINVALMNPNPTARQTKQGPVYRISFEVEPELWQRFMEADTKGMVLAAKMMVTEDGQFIEPDPETSVSAVVTLPEPPERLYGQQAKTLRLSGFFRTPAVWVAVGGDVSYQRWCHKQKCWACSRPPGGAVPIEYAHVRRARNSGTGYKPKFSGLPLCKACHRAQHNQGESVLGDKDLIDKAVIEHLERWAWVSFKEMVGYESMAEVPPEKVCRWAKKHGIDQYLPGVYLTTDEPK